MRFQQAEPRSFFLFDLDGTLIESRSDIALAVNLALVRMELQPLADAKIARFVGDGVQKLIQRALGEALGREPAGDLAERTLAAYLEEYERHLLDSTHLYPGVPEVLDSFWWGKFAVVTNKPERFSRAILAGLGIAERFAIILGGDSTPLRKPDPGPLLEAMARCLALPAQAVMIGDSPTDILAGKAAGVLTCGIAGGFRGRTELEAAGSDLIVESFAELAGYFCRP